MPTDDVVRISTKGRKKFAIGDEDDPRKLPVFQVDVVVAFYKWVDIDNQFRNEDRIIPDEASGAYNEACVNFVKGLMDVSTADISTAEASDFVARLREQYDACADFFVPKLRGEQDSPSTSEGPALQFMEEAS